MIKLLFPHKKQTIIVIIVDGLLLICLQNLMLYFLSFVTMKMQNIDIG